MIRKSFFNVLAKQTLLIIICSNKTRKKNSPKIIIYENILLRNEIKNKTTESVFVNSDINKKQLPSMNVQIDMPSSFKRNFFWSDTTATLRSEKRKKEKVPSVATSDQ